MLSKTDPKLSSEFDGIEIFDHRSPRRKVTNLKFQEIRKLRDNNTTGFFIWK